jgi:hypothetical protein
MAADNPQNEAETDAAKASRSSKNQGIRWGKKSINAFGSIKYYKAKVPERNFYRQEFSAILPISRPENTVRVDQETIRFLVEGMCEGAYFDLHRYSDHTGH